jgi:hypothetical protein
MSIESDAFLCGWRVQSEIPLPELLPWSQPGAGVDINIRLGSVPPLADVTGSTPRMTSNGAGLCRVEIPDVVTFSVRDGREIVLDPLVSPSSLEVHNYLLGTGLGLLCHQRGVFPLHGSCVQFGGKAVIFSGRSGAGKSTLAAALAHRGHILLADDVCVLTETERGWEVWPAFPRVKLHPASLQAVQGKRTNPSQVNLQGKYHFRFEPVGSFALKPVPLEVIYFLEKTEDGEAERIIDLSSLECLALLQGQTFRRRMGFLLGCREFLFQSAARIAANVPTRQLRRDFDLTRMETSISILEKAHGIAAQTA